MPRTKGHLNAPRIRVKPPGPKARRIIALDHQYTSPSYTRCYPLVVERGRGAYVQDVDGNVYLDFTSGVAVNTLGHSPPEVVAAIREQAAKFLHMAGTDFYYAPMAELARRLSEITPGPGRKKSFLTNSGAEAVEAAIKLARYATGRPRIIAFLGAFHGRTMGALSLTASKAVHRERFAPLLPDITHIPYGYCYRCPYHLEPKTCDIYCLQFLEEWIFPKVAPAKEVAAVIVEPIQGEGGYVVPPPGYFQTLRRICDKHGILLIADEIQSGMGRTGKMFAIEHWGVVPDIVCVAKGIANGVPMGAILAREALHTWPSGAHANTFGGNPLACVAALAVLDRLQGGLLEEVAERGRELHDGLRRLQADHPSIGDVRGIGLMQGAEIVRDPATKEKAPDLRNRIVQRCFRDGLLLMGAGETSIRFLPPLNVSKREIEIGLEFFCRALAHEEPR